MIRAHFFKFIKAGSGVNLEPGMVWRETLNKSSKVAYSQDTTSQCTKIIEGDNVTPFLLSNPRAVAKR